MENKKQDFVLDILFEKQNFSENPLPALEFENCTFRNCDFFKSNLQGVRFCGCKFENCNLTLANIEAAVLQDIVFTDCKMLGIRFDTCSRFGFLVSFTACVLDNSSFRATKLKKTKFEKCRMREVDFSECDLNSAIFQNCDLDRAVFHYTILEKADMRSATNLSLDPEINNLRKAKFSLYSLPGLLSKYNIIVEE